jgi:hypothetical protein
MIHRDFHPENALWSRGRLTGIVDWTQASWGPPGLDLGHMRWNLVLDGGQPIADQFLARYQALTGTSLDDQPPGISSACSTFYSIRIQTTPAISTPTTTAGPPTSRKSQPQTT